MPRPCFAAVATPFVPSGAVGFYGTTAARTFTPPARTTERHEISSGGSSLVSSESATFPSRGQLGPRLRPTRLHAERRLRGPAATARLGTRRRRGRVLSG